MDIYGAYYPQYNWLQNDFSHCNKLMHCITDYRLSIGRVNKISIDSEQMHLIIPNENPFAENADRCDYYYGH